MPFAEPDTLRERTRMSHLVTRYRPTMDVVRGRVTIVADGATRPRRAGWIMIMLVVLLVSACAVPPLGPLDPRRPTFPAEPARSAPLPPDQIVLEVTGDSGGLAPQALYAVTSPALVIYGDGRVVLLGRTPSGSDLRRSYQVATVEPELVAGLADRARAAGLAENLELGSPKVLDAGSTLVRVHGTGEPVTHRAYAFYPEVDRRLGWPYQQRRELLRLLIKAGYDLAGDAPRSPYVPDRIFVYEQKVTADAPATRPWSGPDPATFLTGPRSFRGLRCGELRGAQAEAVYDASAQNANQHWTVDGTVRLLLINSLPGSRLSCA